MTLYQLLVKNLERILKREDKSIGHFDPPTQSRAQQWVLDAVARTEKSLARRNDMRALFLKKSEDCQLRKKKLEAQVKSLTKGRENDGWRQEVFQNHFQGIYYQRCERYLGRLFTRLLARLDSYRIALKPENLDSVMIHIHPEMTPRERAAFLINHLALGMVFGTLTRGAGVPPPSAIVRRLHPLYWYSSRSFARFQLKLLEEKL